MCKNAVPVRTSCVHAGWCARDVSSIYRHIVHNMWIDNDTYICTDLMCMSQCLFIFMSQCLFIFNMAHSMNRFSWFISCTRQESGPYRDISCTIWIDIDRYISYVSLSIHIVCTRHMYKRYRHMYETIDISFTIRIDIDTYISYLYSHIVRKHKTYRARDISTCAAHGGDQT